MITVTSAELNALIAGLIWPLTRILGLIAAAPLFGNRSIPARVKLGLAILLTIIVAPVIPPVPRIELVSLSGLLIVMQQIIIGLAMGFAMRIVFAAIEFAGEVIGLTMGLGFATFFDPQTQGRSSAISQFLGLLAIMLFLASNIHVMLLAVLVESFTTLPIAGAPMTGGGFYRLAEWGGRIFSAGTQLALPMVAALLITNMALGILTRAAPQLNLFAIGFPLTISVGFIVILLSLPYLATPVGALFIEGIDMVRQIAGVSAPGPLR
jgi:flagellar biosynthetic protein FliR